MKKEISENRRLKMKYYNKKIHSKEQDIPFELSMEEFMQLTKEANITSKDIAHNGYHLARYNDSGAYKIGNCRFIYYKENYAERKVSDRSRNASMINVKKAIAVLNGENKAYYKEKSKKNKLKWWNSLSDKEKRDFYLKNYDSTLTDEEIKRRHDVIRQIPNKKGRLTKASEILKITPQVIGRFLKKYPLIE
jgi:hypothetical protein